MREYGRYACFGACVFARGLALALLGAGAAWADFGVPITPPAPLNTNASTDTGFDGSATLATDGAGLWIAAWHSREEFGGTLGPDGDILTARSMNQGGSWSDPAPLNTNAATDGRDDSSPSLATDGQGRWVATWVSRFGGATGPDLDIIVARSGDDGLSWTDPAPLNTNAASDGEFDGEPQVATDGLGTWVAVWSADPTLSGPFGSFGGFDDADILSARSINGGESWSDPVRLTPAPQAAGNQGPRVATDGAGLWLAVWSSADSLGDQIDSDFDLLVARSEDGGATWSAPVPLNTDAAADELHDALPQIATDGAGRWVVAWTRLDTLGQDFCCSVQADWDFQEVRVARSLDDGATWSDPTPLNNLATGLEDEVPDALVTDFQGSWVAAWRSTHTLGDTIDSDFDFLVARSSDLGASWTDPVPLNTSADTDGTGAFFNSADLATDGVGRWVAVMDSDDPLGGPLGTDDDILVARFALTAADANALDLQIDAFGAAFSHTSIYLASSEAVTATLDLEASVQCSAPTPRFDADIRVVGLDASGGVATEFPLGTATFEPEEVSAREVPTSCATPSCVCDASSAGARRFQLPVSGGGFETFLTGARAAGHMLEIRARIDSSDAVAESDEGNNEATDFFPALVPLTGDLRFGPVVTHIQSFTGFPGGACGPDAVDLSGSEVEWTPSTNGRWDAVRFFAPAGLCAQLVPNGEGFDLVALGSVAIPRVSGEMGGLSVEVLGTRLDASGATPGLLRLALPDGHSHHAADAAGRPVPRGRDVLEISLVSIGLTDFAQLESEGGAGFLHANGMPLSFEVTELKLTQDAIIGSVASAHYHYDLPFHASDRRFGVDVRSNDTRLRHVTSIHELRLDSNGLQIPRVDFAAGSARTHFPRMRSDFAAFDLRVENGALAEGQLLPAGGRYILGQVSSCPGCPRVPPVGVRRAPLYDVAVGPQGVGSDGAVVARVERLGENPRWGPHAVSGGRNLFARTTDASLPGVLFLPGYRAHGSGGEGNRPVSEYLLGMRAVDEDAGALLPSAHHALGDDESHLGNHFMAGITVGPEFYHAVDGRPAAGVGRSLDGTGMEIGFGGPEAPDFRAFVSSLGTKYVIRPGGVTGVFNTDVPPQPTAYGFDLQLSRFAFRQVSNALDPTNWIDGAVAVPAPGGFEVAFSSLALDCNANLGDLLVETCRGAGDPAESCRLEAWRADFDVHGAEFAECGGPPSRCETGDRGLHVDGSVDIAALDRRVDLRACWSPLGIPSHAVVKGSTDYLVDGDSGFRFAANEVVDLPLSQGSPPNEFGWFTFTGLVGVPFWDSLRVQARFQNEHPDRAQPSILVKYDVAAQQGTLGDLPDESEQENHELVRHLDDTPTTHSSAQYEWGSTGYRIELPLYYEPDRPEGVRFRGVPENLFDLVVLTARAGVDWVTPERTKLSFGASADFHRLAALEFDLHVDVGDSGSIDAIDDFLEGLHAGRPVAAVVGPLQTGFTELSRVGGGGLDRYLEEAVTAAIAAVGEGVFRDLAVALAEVAAVRAQLGARVDDLRSVGGQRLVEPLTLELDDAMSRAYTELPGQLLVRSSDELAHSLRELEVAQGSLGDVESAISDLESTLGVLRAHVPGLLGGATDTGGFIDGAQAAIGSLRTQLDDTNLGVCPGGAVRGRLDDALAAIDEVQRQLGLVNLALPLGAIGAATGVDLSGVASAQRQIRALAEDAGVRVARAQAELAGVLNDLCSGTPDVLAGANDYLDRLENDLDRFREALRGVHEELLRSDGALAQAEDGLREARPWVEGVRSVVTRLADDTRAVLRGDPLHHFPFATAPEIQDALDHQIALATGDALRWRLGDQSFVVPLGVMLRGPFDLDLRAAADAAEQALRGLTQRVPSPTARDVRALLVDRVMNHPLVEDAQRRFRAYLSDIVEELTDVVLDVFDQLNHALRAALEQVQASVRAALDEATGVVEENWAFRGGKLDGFATIQGDALERLHVAGEWTMVGGAEDNTTTYGAALDVTSWSANGKSEGCAVANGQALLDAKITGENLPFRLGPSDARLRRVYLGFTLQDLAPVGLFGGLEVAGTIDFTTFQLYDIAFASGIGLSETFLGASAGATFDDTQMEVAFLVGRTCSDEVLTSLDPQAGEFITLPRGEFNGAFVRGAASFPVWNNGCFLTLGVGADAGSWLLIGPPLTFGGVLGGAAFGKALCIASLRGQVTLLGQKTGLEVDLGSFRFEGEGWGAAGVGFCEPGGWSSVARSRSDSWCATGDAQFSARYDGGFELRDIRSSAVH
jgi:hypothetical protein